MFKFTELNALNLETACLLMHSSVLKLYSMNTICKKRDILFSSRLYQFNRNCLESPFPLNEGIATIKAVHQCALLQACMCPLRLTAMWGATQCPCNQWSYREYYIFHYWEYFRHRITEILQWLQGRNIDISKKL